MPVNWKDPEAFTRLLAAMVAAQDMKLDYRKIATMYGNGATYDSIEGRFRIIKKEAANLKAEIDNGVRAEAPPRGVGNSTPKRTKTSTPKKDKTHAGRINKSATPSKKLTPSTNNVRGIKEEMESSASSFIGGTSNNGDDSGADADGDWYQDGMLQTGGFGFFGNMEEGG